MLLKIRTTVARSFYLFLVLLIFSQSVSALSAGQKQLFDNSINYLNLDDCTPTGLTSEAQTTTAPGKNAYVLGDSISDGLHLANLEQALKTKIGGDAQVNYNDGRSITRAGNTTFDSNDTAATSALDAVKKDQAYIQTAGIIVIVLGTNQTDDPFDQSQKQLLDALKAVAPDANYYWVDIGATEADQVPGWDARNKIIYSNAASRGYTVISRYKAMFGQDKDPLNLTPNLAIPGSSGYIHGDYPPVVDAISNAVSSGHKDSSSTSSCCNTSSSSSGTGTLPSSVPAPYNAIITASAKAAGTDPLIVATIFLTENGYTFPNPPPPYGTGPAWPVSPAAASGPFQFISAAWASYGQNGDINDLKDAAGAAARYLFASGGKAGIPLGSLADSVTNKPSVANVLGSYNAGPAADFPAIPETINYITKGLAIYQQLQAGTGNFSSAAAANSTASADASAVTVSSTVSSASCSSGGNGAVAGNIVQTAENYAWPDFQAERTVAKESYQQAWAKYDNASNYTDCSAFVATVMISSGADPNYPHVGTAAQKAYIESHPEKYIVIKEPTSTAQLKPGDIMIHDDGNNGHTLLYIGDSHWQGADASLGSHTPQVSPDVTWMFSESNDIAARLR
jgi:hypothetical protein